MQFYLSIFLFLRIKKYLNKIAISFKNCYINQRMDFPVAATGATEEAREEEMDDRESVKELAWNQVDEDDQWPIYANFTSISTAHSWSTLP